MPSALFGLHYLATKFPGYDPANMDKVEDIFERQLEKCQTPYFDFYKSNTNKIKNVSCFFLVSIGRS